MKKQIVSVAIVLAMFVGIASAATTRDLRWAYFATSSAGIIMTDGGINWSGDASTYTLDAVTKTKVTVKLQVATDVGWGTIETKTDSDTNDVGASGLYTGWYANKSYRVEVEAWAYNGTKELEHIGPFYDYLYT